MAQLLKRNMRLFGLPYQFLPSVDQRNPYVSSEVGRKFAENIILDAPVVTIIPGRPKFLSGNSNENKQTTAQALIEASSDMMGPLKSIISDKAARGDDFRYYDFERSYTEYMKYVNILCRACAGFLEIDETIDGIPCTQYDYRDYKWNTDRGSGDTSFENLYNNITSGAVSFVSGILSKKDNDGNVNLTSSDTSTGASGSSTDIKYETTSSDEDEDGVLEELMTHTSYVQFFVDVDSSFSESMSNATSESQIKSKIMDSASGLMKEFAFLTGSAGAEGLTDFVNSTTDAATELVNSLTGGSTETQLTGAISRVINLAGNVVKGENVIMPDIYQSSSYEKSYTFTVHLKSPYGTKFGYFMDICVPMMHLIALGLPKQTTANTYGSPFLVKAYCEGIFTCNLGIVQSISISKGVNSAYSVDGLPTEVDVSITIIDLYSDLSMSPQSSPILFLNNDSLIEYLATTCGLSLIAPNIQTRIDTIVNTIQNAFKDIDDTIISSIGEEADKLARAFFKIK